MKMFDKAMYFIEREKEISDIKQALEAGNPSLIIVRGRRRMGKTTLLGKVLSEKDVYFEADRTPPQLAPGGADGQKRPCRRV